MLWNIQNIKYILIVFLFFQFFILYLGMNIIKINLLFTLYNQTFIIFLRAIPHNFINRISYQSHLTKKQTDQTASENTHKEPKVKGSLYNSTIFSSNFPLFPEKFPKHSCIFYIWVVEPGGMGHKFPHILNKIYLEPFQQSPICINLIFFVKLYFFSLF